MNKAQILKYIRGGASISEKREIINWIEKSEANKHYYLRLKEDWMLINIPQGEASKRDLENFISAINNPNNKKSNWKKYSQSLQKIAAILFIPLMIYTCWDTFTPKEANNPYSQDYITYYANKGLKSRFYLPDSTEVWLNSDSYIKVPSNFERDNRSVFLSGEAFFNVKSDINNNFTINTQKNFSIKVTGTSFNVCCYNDDNYVYTTLVEGRITAIIKDTKSSEVQVIELEPNDLLSYYYISGSFNCSKVNTYNYTSWKEGWLCFDNMPLKDVVKKLSRWYGYNFIIKYPQLQHISLTAKFSSESVSQVMELIKKSAGIDYQISDTVVTIY